VAAFSLANAVYPAYLLNSALLTVSYCVSLGLQRKWRTSLKSPGYRWSLRFPSRYILSSGLGRHQWICIKDLVEILVHYRIPTMPTRGGGSNDESVAQLCLIALGVNLPVPFHQGDHGGHAHCLQRTDRHPALYRQRCACPTVPLAVVGSGWFPTAATVVLASASAATAKILERSSAYFERGGGRRMRPPQCGRCRRRGAW